MRWAFAETVAAAGHEIAEARDGGAAIRAMSQRIDIILLAYGLPDSDDLGLLSTLRRLAPDAAVILTTAFGGPEVISGALRLGAYRTLAKPVEMNDVAAFIDQANRSRPV